MISADTAYSNMLIAQKRGPIAKISTIGEMIKISSLLGFEKVECFITVKNLEKIKSTLKAKGYIVGFTYAESLPDEILIEIKWNTSQLVGETIKELRDV